MRVFLTLCGSLEFCQCVIYWRLMGQWFYGNGVNLNEPSKFSGFGVFSNFYLWIFPIYRYFGQWAQKPETRAAFEANLTSMGEF